MQPSPKETPFKLKNISDSNCSTASKTLELRGRNCLMASRPPRGESKGNNKAVLLTLPFEIRLQIYHLVLISRSNLPKHLHPGNTRQLMVERERPDDLHNRSIGPEILQTCKQIYQEANSILYSQNVFQFPEPCEALEFIERIGRENFKLVKTLEVSVYTKTELFLLPPLFDILGEGANGLQTIELKWGFTSEYSGELRGLGAKLGFKGALKEAEKMMGIIVGLEQIHWPIDEIRKVLEVAIAGGAHELTNLPFVRMKCSGRE